MNVNRRKSKAPLADGVESASRGKDIQIPADGKIMTWAEDLKKQMDDQSVQGNRLSIGWNWTAKIEPGRFGPMPVTGPGC